LFEQAAEPAPQVWASGRGKSHDDKCADGRRRALALEGGRDFAQNLQSRLVSRSEIDERCDGFAIRKQSLSLQLREYPVRNIETVRPDQPTILSDPPRICYMSADHLLSPRGTAEHQPLESHHFGARAQIDLRLSANTRPIEEDRFLREPGESCGLLRR
jgi:hypothetical protein